MSRRSSGPPSTRRRARRGGALVVGLALAAAVFTAAPAAAASASGPDGQQVTVTPSSGLDPDGQRVTVTGSGFDTSKGIYVGLCVDNGPGQAPSPCLGGVDMEGAGGASAWISSNPPAYGEGVATPFTETGGRGSFSVTLDVAARDAFTDCLDPQVAPNGCVIGTRADHTRTADRSADVRIPVSFATGGSADDADDAGAGAAAGDTDADAASDRATGDNLASTGAAVGGAVLLAALPVAGGVVAARRRPRTES